MLWHLCKCSSLIWNHLLHLPWAPAGCSRSSVPEMHQSFHHKIFVHPDTPPPTPFNSYFFISSRYNHLFLSKIFPDLPHSSQARSVSFVISCLGSVFFSLRALLSASNYTFLQSAIWSTTSFCNAQILSSLKTKTVCFWPSLIHYHLAPCLVYNSCSINIYGKKGKEGKK